MRKRTISEYTEIQANQPNEIQDTIEQNLSLVIDGIIGASTGVVSGLGANITSGVNRIMTVSSGAICNGSGKFYELLADTEITLPNSNGTYTIYTSYGSVNTNLVSGWTLIDVENQVEDYQVTSTLAYDAITINYFDNATGSISFGEQPLWTATISGGVLTAISDIRNYITLGNVLSNSLQNFYTESNNSAHESNQITGSVLQHRDGKFIAFEGLIDNAFTSGIGVHINNGSNASTIGFLNTVNNNIGFKSIITSAGTGFVIQGSGSNDYGIKTTGTKTAMDITTIATGTGINITGVDSTDKGINMSGLAKSIVITGLNALSATGTSTTSGDVVSIKQTGDGNGLKIISTYSSGTIPNGILLKTEFLNGSKGIKLKVDDNVNQSFETGIEINDSAKGIVINNNAGGRAIVINGCNSTDYGLIVTNTANGYSVTTAKTGYTANASGDVNDDWLLNKGFRANVKTQGIGYYVGFDTVTTGVALYVDQTDPNIVGITGIVLNSCNSGIKIKNTAKGITVDNTANGRALQTYNADIEVRYKDGSGNYSGTANTIINYDGVLINSVLGQLNIITSYANGAIQTSQANNKLNVVAQSNNYHYVFAGTQTVADKTIFPDNAVIAAAGNLTALTAVYDAALSRYRLLFWDGGNWRMIPYISNITSDADGTTTLTGTSGESMSLKY